MSISMKKLILKTALITLGVAVVLGVSVFGLMSLWAPDVMMRFTASLGMDGASGDYAFQEYDRSGDIAYLAHSFEAAVSTEDDKKADERFDLFFENDGFNRYCSEQGVFVPLATAKITYRDYVCGQGACVKYRLAQTEEEKEAVCGFAYEQTQDGFPTGNPVIVLASEAALRGDKAFCEMMLTELKAQKRFTENWDYSNIVKILEDTCS